MDDIVVVAIAQRLEDLSHVVTVEKTSRYKSIEKTKIKWSETKEQKQNTETSPGYCFAVDKTGVCPLHDLETQVCSIHTDEDTERISVAQRSEQKGRAY